MPQSAPIPRSLGHAVTIGDLSRDVISACIRKWMNGANLDEAERQVVNSMLLRNDTVLRAQALEDRP